ncbi:MAG: CinA family protein [Ruminococcus sp.]|nr:CinA family protein [Ruminococcus sp.]
MDILNIPVIGEEDEKRIRESYTRLTKKLTEKKLTLTAMESCTAGQIISLITDTEGSSAVVKGSFVTYSNEAKIMNGVPKEIIEKYGAYSPQTAAAMSSACRNFYNADIGIGVTGSMGNVDPNNSDSVVGEVYFAIDFRNDVNIFKIEMQPQKNRLYGKLAAAGKIAEKLNNLTDR